MSNLASGWYPDPDGKPSERYWDGSNWTEQTRPIADKPSNAAAFGGCLIVTVVLAVIVLVTFSCVKGDDAGGAASAPSVQEVKDAEVQENQTSETKDLNSEVSSESSIQESLKITGSGDGNTKPFILSSGDYEVSYETFNDCSYFADLEKTSDDILFMERLFTLQEADKGTNYIYAIEKDMYYISVITGPSCAWEVEFTPL